MNKFSIIIPTLWKSKRIHKLLNDLIKCDSVDEIIIIDNSNEYYKHYDKLLDKVILLSQTENIFVNPAWNLGVSISSNNSIALINDDINFNTNIFNLFSQSVLDTYGIIGMDSINYTGCINNPTICFETKKKQRFGWGCMIIFDKKYWVDIPNEMKIWFGDDFIRLYNPNPISYLTNFKIETDMSTTSKEHIWNETKRNDGIYFRKLVINK